MVASPILPDLVFDYRYLLWNSHQPLGNFQQQRRRALLEASKEIRKPMAVASLDLLENIASDYQILLKNGIPLNPDPRRAANALAKYAGYGAFVHSS